MAESKALTLHKEEVDIIKQVGGTLFKDIDYNALDTSVEALGNYTGDMTHEERMSASEVIDTFEDRVVSTLDNKASKLRYFRDLLTLPSHTDFRNVERFLTESAIGMLLSQEVFKKHLEAYQELCDEKTMLEDYRKQNVPMEPFIDEDSMTPIQAANLRSQHQIAKRKYNSAVNKKEYMLRKNFYAFKKALDADTAYKHFLDALELQLKDSKEASSTVKEKCGYAKMNILISSAEVRQVLRDLHDFAKTVR